MIICIETLVLFDFTVINYYTSLGLYCIIINDMTLDCV